MTVNIEPWGGGSIESAPSLINCPLACIRPFDRGREVTLTAHPTSGFTFESWTDACAGQSNPCKLTDFRRRTRHHRSLQRPYVPQPPRFRPHRRALRFL